MADSELSTEQLEQMAALMARAIPDLDCPECCDCNWVYEYVERSARIYQEQYEWAVLFQALWLRRARRSRSAE